MSLRKFVIKCEMRARARSHGGSSTNSKSQSLETNDTDYESADFLSPVTPMLMHSTSLPGSVLEKDQKQLSKADLKFDLATSKRVTRQNTLFNERLSESIQDFASSSSVRTSRFNSKLYTTTSEVLESKTTTMKSEDAELLGRRVSFKSSIEILPLPSDYSAPLVHDKAFESPLQIQRTFSSTKTKKEIIDFDEVRSERSRCDDDSLDDYLPASKNQTDDFYGVTCQKAQSTI